MVTPIVRSIQGALLAVALFVSTTATCSSPPDSAWWNGKPWQVSVFTLSALPVVKDWTSDSLAYASASRSNMRFGAEVLIRRNEDWSFGLQLSYARYFQDALHRRYTETISDDHWVYHGEQVGLDERVIQAGVLAAYEVAHYPRRRAVGMSAQLGGGLSFINLTEEAYVIRAGQADVTGATYLGSTYRYTEHENEELLLRKSTPSVAGQVWLRGDLHFGRRFSLWVDLGYQIGSSMNMDGASYTTLEGTALSVLPHRTNMSTLLLRSGLCWHFGDQE